MGQKKVVRKRKLAHVSLKKNDPRLRFQGQAAENNKNHISVVRSEQLTKKEQQKIHKLGKKQEDTVVSNQARADQFFEYNPNLGPPYHVLLDTSFLNATVKQRLDLVNSLMDCLCAKATPYVTDCVINELERHGREFAIALRIAKDPRVKKLKCDHENIGYADDCLCNRAKTSKCYIIASNDADLKRRIRKIPGIPIMTVKKGKYGIEKLPEAEFF